MAKLTEPQQEFIVRALACFDTPSQVSAAVKEEFGIDVPRNHIAAYDPTKAHGKKIRLKLTELFHATRAAFLDEAAKIPIAQQAFRLRALSRMFQQAESRKNLPLAAQLLEMAAKEIGGAFTNKRELTGKDGKPLIPTQPVEMSDEQLAAIAAGGSGG